MGVYEIGSFAFMASIWKMHTHSLVHICLLSVVDIVYMAAARYCVLGVVGRPCTNALVVRSSSSLWRSKFEHMDLQIFFYKYLK